MVRFVLVLMILSVLLDVSDGLAQSGSVSGKITITKPDELVQGMMRDRAMNRYSSHNGSAGANEDAYTLAEEAVIYVEPFKSETSYDPPATHPALNQRGMLFHPLVLPVLVGTTVDFPNNDNLFHNVFSISQTSEFDLGRYPKGQKKSVTFQKPGSVSVFCDIHSYMYATVLVLTNPFFTTPDTKGNYTLSEIPPGEYRVTFFYGRKRIETKDVTITAGETTNANFIY